jgi:hypothetical protein
MFYPGSGSDHFLIPDPDPNIFSSLIPDPVSYMKSECKSTGYGTFFLASNAFRSKALVLFIVKKIRDPGKKFIPDPGGKKAPDPGSRSATMYVKIQIRK